LVNQERDTAGILRAARRVAELEPANFAAARNLAWFLLLRGEELPQAHALAAKNLADHPEVPLTRVDAAYSLNLQGRPTEGAKLLAGLPPELLSDPSVCATAGAVLAAAGQRDEARKLLEKARAGADQLLPEELRLVDRALAP
jgi:hypothetical protein